MACREMGTTTRSLSHSLGMITELSTYTQNVYLFVSKTHDNNNSMYMNEVLYIVAKTFISLRFELFHVNVNS